MSAFGTKKRGADKAVQLTFPSVYESIYAAARLPEHYLPTAPSKPLDIIVGDDFQADYHEQKKKDADYMAMAKVEATRNARHRALVSPHGYFGLPATVLAQRQFANPSNGSFVVESSRRDGSSAPFQTVEAGAMKGGVLRSAEGQAYGKARLVARIQQLNTLDEQKSIFLGSPMGMLPPEMAAPPTEMAAAPTPMLTDTEEEHLTANFMLQSVIDLLMSNRPERRGAEAVPALAGSGAPIASTRLVSSEIPRMLSIVFRIAPRSDAEQLETLLAKVDTIVQLLQSYIDPDYETQLPTQSQDDFKATALTLTVVFTKLRYYLQEMSKPELLNRSDAERLAASRNIVKTLKLSQILSAAGTNFQELLSLASRERGLLTPAQRQLMTTYNSRGQFDRVGTPREDTEAAAEGNPTRGDRRGFTVDDRQNFARQSGAYFGETPLLMPDVAEEGAEGLPLLMPTQVAPQPTVPRPAQAQPSVVEQMGRVMDDTIGGPTLGLPAVSVRTGPSRPRRDAQPGTATAATLLADENFAREFAYLQQLEAEETAQRAREAEETAARAREAATPRRPRPGGAAEMPTPPPRSSEKARVPEFPSQIPTEIGPLKALITTLRRAPFNAPIAPASKLRAYNLGETRDTVRLFLFGDK
jgi:hypothetical protein